MKPILTDEKLNTLIELFKDFELFCELNFKILDFNGELIPLKLNRPQKRYIKQVLAQWERTGKIRSIITKARKMGFSTVITAFILWYIMTHVDKHAIAGTHHQDTNQVFVDMVNRFISNMPCKPSIQSSNAGGVVFKALKSSYKVNAASNVKKTGRGDTVQALHVSEIAHIDNAELLPGSLFSTVPNVPDTMIFLESTANGMNNYHHSVFTQAERGDPGCEYEAFFAAWFEDERYQKPTPEGFKLNDEELKEKSLYNLSDEQMCWRREMLATMGNSPEQALAQFRQEYPSNSAEAFQYSPVNSFIEADLIIQAMKRPLYISSGAIIAGYDPSFKGKDRDAFIYRQGANMWGLETPDHFGEDEDARVAYLKNKLDAKIPYIDMLFIDAGAGYGIASRLANDGYSRRVRRIEFGASADNTLKYKTKRDEMFGNFVELLTDKHMPLSIDVGSKRDMFLQDLTATGYKFDNYGRPRMETKESMRKRGVRSTDLTDAAILTTAQKVIRNYSTAHRYTQTVDNTQVYI